MLMFLFLYFKISLNILDGSLLLDGCNILVEEYKRFWICIGLTYKYGAQIKCIGPHHHKVESRKFSRGVEHVLHTYSTHEKWNPFENEHDITLRGENFT